MSGLLDQAGLTAGSGLTNGAGLYRWGNFNPFDPTDLDPYLLFDTGAGSMIGTLENPTLDLDPSNQETLDVITATRAGVATYTDADGNIASASPDTVRVDYVDSVPMILVEPSSVNLVSYSEDFSHNSWGMTGITVLENEATSPAGTNTASKLLVDSTSAFHFAGTICSLGAEPSSFSCYLKANTANTASLFLTQSGNNGAVFDLQAGLVISVSGTGNTATIEDVGEGWFRCVLTNNGSADVNDSLRIGVANGAISGFQGNGTDSIYAWGAQVETGSVSTSYIPTSGGNVAARTRAADDLVISGSDFSDFYNASEGTVYFEGTSNGITDPRLFEFSDGTTSNRTKIDINDGSNFRVSVVNSGSVIVNEEVSFTGANSLFRAALSFKVNDFEGNLNGVSVINETPASLPTLDQLHVGSNHDGAANHLNGHIKRLIYWPTHSSRL